MTFLNHSIKNAFNFFKEAIFSEDIARSKGILQRMDPRLKILLFFSLIILTCFLKNIPQLLIFYCISIMLAVVSGISIPFFVKRVWFFIPLFTLFIAIPAVFMYGIESAIIFVLRVTTCVSFAVLMTITTRHNILLKSLRSLGIPNIFVQILDMTYRYIFFFVKVFEEMHVGLKSRLVKKFDGASARKWVGARIAFLFRRSIKMSEDVYMAMLARGYTGEFKKYGR
jgi:cobalt/nickel transport system permease protein